jgi:hypothetical protein
MSIPTLILLWQKLSAKASLIFRSPGAATVRQGENVLTIGNPGDAMLFSVTKGIVSASRPLRRCRDWQLRYKPRRPSAPATAVAHCAIPAAK